MAFTGEQNLKDTFKAFMHRPNITDLEYEWFAEQAYDRCGKEMRVLSNLDTRDIERELVPAGQLNIEMYPLPDRTQEIQTVSYDENGRPVALPALSQNQAERIDPNGPRPVGYRMITVQRPNGIDLYIRLYPNIDIQLTLVAWEKPALSATLLSSNNWLYNYFDVMLQAMLVYGWQWALDDQRSALANQRYIELRDNANRKYQQSLMNSQSSVSNAHPLVATTRPCRAM